MAPAPRYLDLDAVVAEIPKVVITLKGMQHELKLTSVRDWIEHTKAVQALQAGEHDMAAEFEATCQALKRSFPTADIEHLRDLTQGQLERLLDFVRGYNGQKTAEAAPAPAADAPAAGGDIGSENPPTAG